MKIKGISYGWNSVRGEYCTDDAKRSLEALKNTNSEWIALTFSAWQDNHYSTQIYFDYKDTMTDYDIVCGINYAHSLGLKVCLKPVINIKSKVWRGFIYFPEDDAGDAYWKAWFETYKYFILHYANIAEMLGCEMFCIGCELVFTEFRTDDWMHIIQCVREVYHGPITYNANHGYEMKIEWLSELDYIGTSAYYSVGEKNAIDIQSMMNKWQKYKDEIYEVYKKYNRKIIFMEIGCCSGKGSSIEPWKHPDFSKEFDDEEQANFYISALNVFWDETWFAGIFWWDWNTRMTKNEKSRTAPDFSIYGKKCEKIITEWYKTHV